MAWPASTMILPPVHSPFAIPHLPETRWPALPSPPTRDDLMSDDGDKLFYLTEHDFFRDFNRLEMWALDRRTTMISCEASRIFFEAGEPNEVLFILKKGRVNLFRLTPEGRKLVVATLTDGSVFGEMGLIGQRMHETFAEAMTPVTLCVMRRADVEEMLLKKPQMALRLLTLMSERLQQAERRLEQMAFTPVAARLAAELLTLAKDDAVSGYTHQELADRVGSHRETITLTLNEFKADGLLETGRKRIQISDPAGLLALAEGEG